MPPCALRPTTAAGCSRDLPIRTGQIVETARPGSSDALAPRAPQIRGRPSRLGLDRAMCRDLGPAPSPGDQDGAAGGRTVPAGPSHRRPRSLTRRQLDKRRLSQLQRYDRLSGQRPTVETDRRQPRLTRQANCMVADIAHLKLTCQMPRLRPPGQPECNITWLSFRNVSAHSYGMPSLRTTRTSASAVERACARARDVVRERQRYGGPTNPRTSQMALALLPSHGGFAAAAFRGEVDF